MQIVPDLILWFLFFALFQSLRPAISQTKVIKIVCSLVSIPRPNVRNYIWVSYSRLKPINSTAAEIAAFFIAKFFYYLADFSPSFST